ncbi:glyoxalase [Marinomonas primoryensis]|uniref:Glyoxalase n=1 Tax=Marinomonas primoryensis TaxID=178399 RepID=A0A2Z4PNG1_9GAMM|nr:VOC family protein [Marinomonas primoryensis]AWX98603.1 glyoxalase [Marinomonas primoryensis]
MNIVNSVVKNHAIGIDHIAIAVNDLEEAIAFYEKFGFIVSDRLTIKGKKSGMISAVMEVASLKFVLLQGTDRISQITKFIEDYGPGPQHIAIEVSDINSVCDVFESEGIKFSTNLITGSGLKQRFTERCTNSGVMIELIERNEEFGFSESSVNDLFEQLEAADAI